MRPSSETKRLANDWGFNHIKYLGQYENYSVFVFSLVDDDGMPMPTGLPVICLEQDTSCRVISGDEAFDILSFFPQE